jgi:hypothetical protein
LKGDRGSGVFALSFGPWAKKRIEISVQNFSSEKQSVRKPDLQRGADFFRDRSSAQICFGNDDFNANQVRLVETEGARADADAVAALFLVREVRVQ